MSLAGLGLMWFGICVAGLLGYFQGRKEEELAWRRGDRERDGGPGDKGRP